MKYYISDLHFGHENAIRFDGRPFENADDMDAKMIELWNEKVTENDEVYIVGDFSYKSGKTAERYLGQLKGRKHLIIGNHDRKTLENELAMQHFESVHQMLQIKDEGKWIFLCHYPMAEWNGSRHGSWLIYGHIHGNQNDVFAFMQTRTRALNAGACINNYVPSLFEELEQNNKRFREEYPSMPQPIMPSQLPKVKMDLAGLSGYAKKNGKTLYELSEEEFEKFIPKFNRENYIQNLINEN